MTVVSSWVSLPFLRLCTGQSGAPLERRMPREGPPSQSALTAIMRSKGSPAGPSGGPRWINTLKSTPPAKGRGQNFGLRQRYRDRERKYRRQQCLATSATTLVANLTQSIIERYRQRGISELMTLQSTPICPRCHPISGEILESTCPFAASRLTPSRLCR